MSPTKKWGYYRSSGGRASVQRLAEEVGVAQRAYLSGRLGNVAEWCQRADLFVLSSRYEEFPNVLLEALASGCACVAFDCDSGPRYIIDDGVNGILVPAACTEQLATQIAQLMSDEVSREILGNTALSVRQSFSEERVTALWEQALK